MLVSANMFQKIKHTNMLSEAQWMYETLTRKFKGLFNKTIIWPRSVLRPTFDIRSHHSYFIKLSYLNWLMIILEYVDLKYTVT